MKNSVKIGLFLGAVTIVAGTGLAFAQMEGPMPPDGPMQGLMRGHSRLADRLLQSFDKNHDGKVSHDEMNRAIYATFIAATHGSQTMTRDQFVAMHAAEFRQHAGEMFRRIDWRGIGKLSLEDFAAPQRARFMMMDKDGSGFVSCAGPSSGSRYYGDRENARDQDSQSRRGRGTSRGGFGLSAFCAENDQNVDGKVTRAELDSTISKRFAAASHGTASMTFDQFMAEENLRFQDANSRTFDRLDKDGDGKLSLAEFASSELRLFERLDRNKDGAITADEMKPRFTAKGNRGRKPRSQSGYY